MTRYCCLKGVALHLQQIHKYHFSNQRGVTQESTDVQLLRVFTIYANKDPYRIFVTKSLDLIACFMQMMADRMDMSISWSTWLSKKLPVPDEKVFLLSFLNPESPLPIPINPVYQVVIYIMAHVVLSASPSGPLLRPVSNSYDDDLFHNLLFGLVGPNVTLSQSRFRLWSLITCVQLEFAFSSP